MKQTVEEAAKEYADDNYPGSDLGIRIMAANAFEAGAEWRINSIWHDNTNIPDDNKFCVFTLSDGNCGCGYYHKKDNTIWYENFSNVVRWAYFEDITPNMEN
jgi:hypothetical protein